MLCAQSLQIICQQLDDHDMLAKYLHGWIFRIFVSSGKLYRAGAFFLLLFLLSFSNMNISSLKSSYLAISFSALFL